MTTTTTEPPFGQLLLTPADAARALAISAKHLWRMMKSGTIPHVRLGRSVRYVAADLSAWISANKSRGMVIA